MTTLDGVWRRAGLSLGGAPREEPEHAYWGQAGTQFADVRVTLGGPGGTAFGGSVTVDDGEIWFVHDIAPHPIGVDEDSAALSWEGTTLRETGELDLGSERLTYTEWWRPWAPGPTASFRAEGPEHAGIAIVASGAAVIVVESAAVDAGWVLERQEGVWLVRHSLGSSRPPPVPHDDGIACPRGWSWHVTTA